MADAFTVKSYQMREAPKRIRLLGDKTKRPEAAQHIIEFPGGAIELSRTTDGNYWAHIIVNRQPPVDDTEGLRSARGAVIGSRIDLAGSPRVAPIKGEKRLHQVAVLIRPELRRG